jgi:hypothetical protein
MNLSPREKRMVRIGSVLVIAMLAVKFAILPWTAHWSELRDHLHAQETELAAMNRDAARMAHLNRRLTNRYGPAAVKPRPFGDEAQPAFHKAVQTALQSSGFKLASLDPQSSASIKTAPGLASMTLRVTGTCQPSQLIKLLDDIRLAECLVFVDRMHVQSGAPQKPQELAVTLTLATLVKERPAR